MKGTCILVPPGPRVHWQPDGWPDPPGGMAAGAQLAADAHCPFCGLGYRIEPTEYSFDEIPWAVCRRCGVLVNVDTVDGQLVLRFGWIIRGQPTSKPTGRPLETPLSDAEIEDGLWEPQGVVQMIEHWLANQ